MSRVDETLYRLRDWRYGQTSERLAAQVLAYDGYEKIDPSHPQGGQDGGRDGTCVKDGKPWVYAVYFPNGQKSFSDVKKKFADDLAAATDHAPHGLAFVTNQEITLGERTILKGLSDSIEIDLFHLERVAMILDLPVMAPVRERFIDIDPDVPPIEVDLEIDGIARYFTQADSDRLRTLHLERAAEEAWEQHRARRAPLPPALAGMSEFRNLPEPLTDQQFQKKLDLWREQVEEHWTDSVDHLAATAWPGLGFRVRNLGNVYLNHVKVVITIRGARGVRYQRPESFSYDKLCPPVFKRSRGGLFDHSSALDALKAFPLVPKGYPVGWRDRDDAVEITIDLDRLPPPPTPAFESRTDDLVLILRDVQDPADLTVEWSVTAQGYGEAVAGEPRVIAAQAIPIGEALQFANTAAEG